MTTLVVYEYCVTLETEIRLFWRRKATRSNVLFFFNRYVCLANRVTVLGVEALSQHAVTRCTGLEWLLIMTSCAGLVTMSLISASRIYALWSRNAWLFALIALLGLALPITTLYETARVQTVPGLMDHECSLDYVYGLPGELGSAVWLGRIINILDDVLVVLLTWSRTVRVWRAAVKEHVQANLTYLVLRDGTFIFVAVAAFGSASLLLGIADYYTINIADISALGTILLSRFMLDLRRAADSTDKTGGTMWASDMELSTLQFQDDLYFLNERSEGNASDELDMGWEE